MNRKEFLQAGLIGTVSVLLCGNIFAGATQYVSSESLSLNNCRNDSATNGPTENFRSLTRPGKVFSPLP